MKRTLSTLAVAAGLTGAAFLGGTAISAIASAQDDTTTTTQVAPDSTAPDQPAPDASAPDQGPRPDGCQGEHRPNLDAAATAIGVSVDDLRTALQSGQTIAEVAEANGVDSSTVVDAMVSAAQSHISEEVAAGNLTQEEADQKLADLEQHVTDLVNGELPPRPDHAGQPPADAPTPDSSTPDATS